MFALFKAIPDATVVTNMQPEELAGKILFLLKNHPGDINPHNLESELYDQRNGYPSDEWGAVGQAVREALSWLIGQGLLVPTRGNMAGSWMTLSRRAREFSDEVDFAAYQQAKRLNPQSLHPKISRKVWQAFVRGEYDVAVFLAMKAVETSVRDASGIADIGVSLMRSAFNPKNGTLTDMQSDGGEREARAALFAGAIGSYKNPQSHRDVNLENPDEAIEIIMFANHLLRIVDARRP